MAENPTQELPCPAVAKSRCESEQERQREIDTETESQRETKRDRERERERAKPSGIVLHYYVSSQPQKYPNWTIQQQSPAPGPRGCGCYDDSDTTVWNGFRV